MKSRLTAPVPLRLSILLMLVFYGLSGIGAQEGGASFPWPGGKRAALSLSFDDARLSNVDVGVPLFNRYNAEVTFYVMPGGVKERLEKWKQAVKEGHEIGNHTLVHPCSGLNTGEGRAALYINGQRQGEREIPEPFTWELEKSKIFLGLNYTGLLDEAALFDRALTAEEVVRLYQLAGGLSALVKE